MDVYDRYNHASFNRNDKLDEDTRDISLKRNDVGNKMKETASSFRNTTEDNIKDYGKNIVTHNRQDEKKSKDVDLNKGYGGMDVNINKRNEKSNQAIDQRYDDNSRSKQRGMDLPAISENGDNNSGTKRRNPIDSPSEENYKGNITQDKITGGYRPPPRLDQNKNSKVDKLQINGNNIDEIYQESTTQKSYHNNSSNPKKQPQNQYYEDNIKSDENYPAKPSKFGDDNSKKYKGNAINTSKGHGASNNDGKEVRNSRNMDQEKTTNIRKSSTATYDNGGSKKGFRDTSPQHNGSKKGFRDTSPQYDGSKKGFRDTSPQHDGNKKGFRDTSPQHDGNKKGFRDTSPQHDGNKKGFRDTSPQNDGKKGFRDTSPQHDANKKGFRDTSPQNDGNKGFRDTSPQHNGKKKGFGDTSPQHDRSKKGFRETSLQHNGKKKGFGDTSPQHDGNKNNNYPKKSINNDKVRSSKFNYEETDGQMDARGRYGVEYDKGEGRREMSKDREKDGRQRQEYIQTHHGGIFKGHREEDREDERVDSDPERYERGTAQSFSDSQEEEEEDAEDNSDGEMLDQSSAELKATIDELERRYDTIENEGNEWKTRFETQTEMNQQLEKQILLLQEKVEEAKRNLKEAGKSPRDNRAFDDLADASPQMVKALERERNSLFSQLRDLEWRLDQESKAYHKANDERKHYVLEINATKVNIGELRSKQRQTMLAAQEAPPRITARSNLGDSPYTYRDTGGNIPEGQRIIDPRYGPIRKTAGIKALPSLD